MSDPLRVELSGPLLVFAPGFLGELLGRGSRPGTAAKQLQLMAHLSRWMAAHCLEPGDLGKVELERFVQERRATGTPTIQHLERRAVHKLKSRARLDLRALRQVPGFEGLTCCTAGPRAAAG